MLGNIYEAIRICQRKSSYFHPEHFTCGCLSMGSGAYLAAKTERPGLCHGYEMGSLRRTPFWTVVEVEPTRAGPNHRSSIGCVYELCDLVPYARIVFELVVGPVECSDEPVVVVTIDRSGVIVH